MEAQGSCLALSQTDPADLGTVEASKEPLGLFWTTEHHQSIGNLTDHGKRREGIYTCPNYLCVESTLVSVHHIQSSPHL